MSNIEVCVFYKALCSWWLFVSCIMPVMLLLSEAEGKMPHQYPILANCQLCGGDLLGHELNHQVPKTKK